MTSPASQPIGQLPEVQLVPNRRMPAWLMSFIFHTLVFVVLILAVRGVARTGAAEENNREAGIVLVNADSEKTEFLTEGDVEESSAETTPAASPPPLPAENELPPDLPGFEASATTVTGVGDELMESFEGAEGLIEGDGNTGRIGGKVTTEVFGIKGTGSRFVYAFDRSGSMSGYNGKPLRAAKAQLLASLNSLGKNHQFQVVFYNDAQRVFDPDPGAPEMMFADDINKRRATRFVQGIIADGGTDHLTALNLALRWGPDVIFLLTDAEGGFTRGELRKIAQWNRSGAVINTIEFGVGSQSGNDRSLEQLAREHGGTYVYKNILTLRD